MAAIDPHADKYAPTFTTFDGRTLSLEEAREAFEIGPRPASDIDWWGHTAAVAPEPQDDRRADNKQAMQGRTGFRIINTWGPNWGSQ